MIEIKMVYVLLSTIFILAGTAYWIYNYNRYKKLSNEIDDLKFELSKLNFRLFIAEKKQKTIDQDNLSRSAFSGHS